MERSRDRQAAMAFMIASSEETSDVVMFETRMPPTGPFVWRKRRL
jgi:hypothetical protein